MASFANESILQLFTPAERYLMTLNMPNFNAMCAIKSYDEKQTLLFIRRRLRARYYYYNTRTRYKYSNPNSAIKSTCC